MLLTAEAQGTCLEVIVHPSPTLSRTKSGEVGGRGDITEFSQESRLRLIKLNARISQRKVKLSGRKPVLITLTYKRNNIHFPSAKRDLKVFLQRIARAYPKASGIWKMEAQKRGAIHFHIIFYGLPFVPVKNLQNMWNEVTGEDSKNSLDMEDIRNQKGAQYYVAKYICKEEPTRFEQSLEENSAEEYLENALISIVVRAALISLGLSMPHTRPRRTGRWWGVHNRKGLPLARTSRIEIDMREDHYRAWVSSLREKYARCYRSFTVFSSHCYAYVWRIRQCIKNNRGYYDDLYRRKNALRGFRARLWREDSVAPIFISTLMGRTSAIRAIREANPSREYKFVNDANGGAVVERVLEPSKNSAKETPGQPKLL